MSHVPPWRVFAESVRGTGHVRNGKPGQDASGWRVDRKRGCLIAAVADGSGPARFGDRAARLAADGAIDALVTALHSSRETFDGMLGHALSAARGALVAEARRCGCGLDDLATTLIACVADADHAAVAQVGDGFAVVVDAALVPRGFTRPQGGEFVNETVFLTRPDAIERATIEVFEGPIAGAALLTDGLQRLALKLPQQEPHAPFFASVFGVGGRPLEEARAQLSRFLNSDRVAARTDDDLTLLVAWHDGPG